MKASEKVKREMLELGTHPHVLDLARRVHPTWVVAHGSAADPGVERLAREIGQCIAALHHLQEQGETTDKPRYVAGHGIIVTALLPGAVVIQTEVPKPVLENALSGIIAVVNPDDPPRKQAAGIAAELHRRGVTGVQVSPAEFLHVNN